jgi:hypothetical protein
LLLKFGDGACGGTVMDEDSTVLHPKIFVLEIVIDQNTACFHVVPLVGGETSNDLEVREILVCPLE